MYFNYTLFKLYVYANIFFIAQVWFWGRGQLVFWGASKFSNLLAPRATASTSLMSKPGTVLKFADDTKLYTEVTNEEGGEQLQEDLDKCTEWAKQWMMEFNVAKCKVLHAGRTNRMKEYTMEGKILEKVQEEKDLGDWE